jgi:hypothetical protein
MQAVDASMLPTQPPFLVCGLKAHTITGEAIDGSQSCGCETWAARVCLTWALSGDCRCAVAFHDTLRVVSSAKEWLAVLVTWHIQRARGE